MGSPLHKRTIASVRQTASGKDVLVTRDIAHGEDTSGWMDVIIDNQLFLCPPGIAEALIGVVDVPDDEVDSVP